MKSLRIFFGICVFLITIVVSACSSDTSKSGDALDNIKARGFLKVGVFSDDPPFGFMDNQKQFQGFDIYIAKRFAKDLFGDESKIEFIPVEAAARAEFAKSGKVDVIMANFTKTKEREEVVDFARPYMKVALGVISKNEEVRSIDDLKGKKLIVDKGTTADFYFTKNYPDIELLKFDQNTEAFLALKDGRANALAHDNAFLFAWAKENPGFSVGITAVGDQSVAAPAVKKGNKELLDWLNKEIDKLTSEGFMLQAYNATLLPFYGKEVNPYALIFK